MNYKKMIIERIECIDNEKLLCFIYELLISFQRKWGI